MAKQFIITGGSVDTSMVTATADDVLNGRVIVDSTGAIINGNIYEHNMEELKEIYASEDNGVPSTGVSGTAFTIQAGYYSEDLRIPIKPLDLTTATAGSAVATDIRTGKTAWVNGEEITGTMVEKLGTRSLSLGGSTSIPAGQTGTWNFSCYVEKIKVTTAPLAGQTVGDATADDIVLGKTAWVNGEEITGNLDITLDDTQLIASTPGDALAGDIIKGKIAWVNGEKVIGTMKEYNSLGIDITSDANGGKMLAGTQRKWTVNGFVYRIIAEAAPLSEQTIADAVSSDLALGKTAWVNGELITGTYETGLDVSTATQGDATSGDLIEGKTAWVNGVKITGTIKDYSSTFTTNHVLPVDGTTLYIRSGYYGNSFSVKSKTLEAVTPATAVSTDIAAGKTAWVNGELITGNGVTPVKYGSSNPIISYRVTELGGYTSNTAKLENPIEAIFTGVLTVENNSTNEVFTSDKFSIYLDSTVEKPDAEYLEYNARTLVYMTLDTEDPLVVAVNLTHDMDSKLLWSGLTAPDSTDNQSFKGITGHTIRINIEKTVDFTGGV